MCSHRKKIKRTSTTYSVTYGFLIYKIKKKTNSKQRGGRDRSFIRGIPVSKNRTSDYIGVENISGSVCGPQVI